MHTRMIGLTALTALAAASLPASALVTVNFTEYTLTYDETTVFGGLGFNGSGGATQFSFGWSIPAAVNVASGSAATVTANFGLPSYTLTPAPGYTLSGPVSAFMGNLAYSEVLALGGSSAASASGSYLVNGVVTVPVAFNLDKTPVSTITGFQESGYYSKSLIVPGGTFNSLSFLGGNLRLQAAAGAIFSQAQSYVEFGFQATPVPEPKSYALMFAGAGAVLLLARRRRKTG